MCIHIMVKWQSLLWAITNCKKVNMVRGDISHRGELWWRSGVLSTNFSGRTAFLLLVNAF